jgi:aldehyde dehydrogenase (NAD+)
MKTRTTELLLSLGVDLAAHAGSDLPCRTPVTGETLATLRAHTRAQVHAMAQQSHAAFLNWRNVPAPKRGELVRILGDVLRENKAALGELVSIEAGKILQEGLGEVQEMIDICEFAVGLSRQLYGLTIASERPGHRMMEQWHPIGPVAVISAFNFPVAVWSWNAALALVCGDTVIWKPSEKTPLTALATQALFEQAQKKFENSTGNTYGAISQVALGRAEIGEALVTAPQVALVSATGSTRMGRAVAQACAPLFKRTLLELGGNNAMIVAPSADLEMAVRAITFSAVGTAGQRCTTLRRLIAHASIANDLVARLQNIYAKLPIGSPLESGTLIGPLIDEAAYNMMQTALADARAQGGTVVGGERVTVAGNEAGFYVRPAIVKMPAQTTVMQHETFAPILYVLTYEHFDDAMTLHNEVAQGLSSCIFTTDVREAESFMSGAGSDCGIANVNIGPSGAEIGGAFGGEKETGGGRESGSDSWKAYMRRQTNTINYSRALPLAQGIRFEV